jgi:hypothetical protein
MAVAGSPRQQAQLQAVRAWCRGAAPTAGKGAAAARALTTQLFQHKPSGKKMTDLGEPVEDSHFPEVLRRLNAGEIVADSPQELDEFLGRVFARQYDGFPTPEAVEEGFRNREPEGSNSSSNVVTQNAKDVFNFVFEDQRFFAKKTIAQGGANEAFVPYLAMRLGLGAHVTPTVWYEIDGNHFAVSRWVDGASADGNTIQSGTSTTPDERLLELFIFDYLVASFDRTVTNVFLPKEGAPILIDNEGSLGLNGERKSIVKPQTGAARIGRKSAFLLGPIAERLGITGFNVFPPKRMMAPPKLLDVKVPDRIVTIMVTIADEMVTVMQLLGMEQGIPHLKAGVEHLQRLQESKSLTVGNLLY